MFTRRQRTPWAMLNRTVLDDDDPGKHGQRHE